VLVSLRIKSQLTAAIIAMLLLPSSVGAATLKIPYCIRGERQIIRQVNDFTIICRNLNPRTYGSSSEAIDEISLYRFNGTDLKTAINIVVYRYGLKLVTMNGDRNQSEVDLTITQFWLIDRKFEKWVNDANPDLLEFRRNDLTLLLDALETSPPNSPRF
jgi:hypothetical protein